MKLSSLLSEISRLAKVNNLSEPFICGGVPRDKLLGRQIEFTDIDITTGNGSIHRLAEVVYKRLEPIGATIKILPDSHAQVRAKSLKLDFSSNFMSPKIISTLSNYGIKNPTSMQCEMYSRDFTCNALLMDFNLTKIIDPLGQGIKDIENKFLRTCLDPEITLGNDPRRIPRIFYMAAKLDFEVDPLILEWLLLNPDNINYCKPKYIQDKMLKAFEHNREKTSELLSQTRLWDKLPATPGLIPYLKTASLMPIKIKKANIEGIELESTGVIIGNKINEYNFLLGNINDCIDDIKTSSKIVYSELIYSEQLSLSNSANDHIIDDEIFKLAIDYRKKIQCKLLSNIYGFLKLFFKNNNKIFDFLPGQFSGIEQLERLSEQHIDVLNKVKVKEISKIFISLGRVFPGIKKRIDASFVGICNFFKGLYESCILIQQLLKIFNINFDKYFNEIYNEIKYYLNTFQEQVDLDNQYKEKQQEKRDKKKFDKWTQNAISETQLHGEYGKDDTRDLTWDELDEEDKLALLERGAL